MIHYLLTQHIFKGAPKEVRQVMQRYPREDTGQGTEETETVRFDEAGRLVFQRYSDKYGWREKEMHYGESGHLQETLESSDDPRAFRREAYFYKENGQLLKKESSDSRGILESIEQFGYDEDGKMIQVEKEIRGEGHPATKMLKEYLYDEQGQLLMDLLSSGKTVLNENVYENGKLVESRRYRPATGELISGTREEQKDGKIYRYRINAEGEQEEAWECEEKDPLGRTHIRIKSPGDPARTEYLHAYNIHGDLESIAESTPGSDGNLQFLGSTQYAYQYDSHQNWTQLEAHWEGKQVLKVRREITYW